MSEVVDNAPAAEATTEAPVTEVVESNDVANFYDNWSDQSKAHPSLEKFQGGDTEGIFKSYTELEKLVGYKGDIPSQEADESEWNSFWGKLGRPEDKSGYEFNIPEELAGVEGYESYLDKVRESAIKYNIPKKQAEGFVSEMLEYEKTLASGSNQEQSAAEEAAIQMLADKWGDSKNEMIAGINALMSSKGLSPEVAEQIQSDPQTMILLGDIVKDLDEKGQARDAFMSTQAGTESQIAEIDSQIQSIILETNNPRDPRLDSLLSTRDRLMDKQLA